MPLSWILNLCVDCNHLGTFRTEVVALALAFLKDSLKILCCGQFRNHHQRADGGDVNCPSSFFLQGRYSVGQLHVVNHAA